MRFFASRDHFVPHPKREQNSLVLCFKSCFKLQAFDLTRSNENCCYTCVLCICVGPYHLCTFFCIFSYIIREPLLPYTCMCFLCDISCFFSSFTRFTSRVCLFLYFLFSVCLRVITSHRSRAI